MLLIHDIVEIDARDTPLFDDTTLQTACSAFFRQISVMRSGRCGKSSRLRKQQMRSSLTQAEAVDAGLSVATTFKLVGHTARGWLHSAGNEGFIKLVADTDRGVLVGATSVGPAGGEVLGLLALGVHAEVPLDTLKSMIYAYPTFHKGVEDALKELTPVA